ncbi:hypothetical protein K8O68_07900 [Salipaludibacillus sp. CUR1]|uniref:iron-sulfur cluster biosynthesis family protein n=1 Tax=Salipaludibacillus sp. CUR1 TaxID=2820003 RepID=UPI001E4B1A5F|nr:iron-sulfur cluster biosynthesis family protein [Salipaludibacillus sp. CUR1]MCE7792341.1 hypothetical protein [Salipaludibacillus sp. CUR1]
MNFTITDEALDFYKKEMELKKGDSLTLYVRVGGVGSGGFSAGINRGIPEKAYVTLEKGGLLFCITEDDQWYFDGMTIDYHHDFGEVTFMNERIDDVINPK